MKQKEKPEIEAYLQSCQTVLKLQEKQTKPENGKHIIAYDSSFVSLSDMR